MKIKILDHEIDVEYCNPNIWAENGLGRCSAGLLKILVSNKAAKDIQDSTVLHEIIHMIFDLNSLEYHESTVDALALGINSLIKNNPELIKILQEK